MSGPEIKSVLFRWILVLTMIGLESVVSLSNRSESTDYSISPTYFPFSRGSTFVRLTLEVPLNFTSVYGKVEPKRSSWFVLFEFDHSFIPSTFPAINEEIQAGDRFDKCPNFDAVREVEFELEIHSKYVRIRAGNSERYDFPESIDLGRQLFAEFFVQEREGDRMCTTEVRIEQKEQSRFSLIQPTPTINVSDQSNNSTTDPTDSQRTPRRMVSTVPATTQSPRLWTGKVRFATYKQQRSRITMKPIGGHTYIDIQKDREVYEAVQRSRTKEINSVWSYTFLFFLTIEVIVIGSFVLFGLSMFILLQIRPRGKEKHVAIID